MGKKEIYFDVRVSHRYINDGLITKKEYDESIKKLPDVSDKATKIIIEDEDIEDLETTEQEEGEEE